MDDTRAFATDTNVERDFPAADEPRMDVPPMINLDERRMHVRAYNFWVSLLKGRPFPSIVDFDAAGLDDFGPYGLLLDFTHDATNPAILFLGDALRAEGEIIGSIASLSDVPPRSVLSRLTDHYLQIIANRAPIGFEAEYINYRGIATMYRGILMPFTSNGGTIDYIYGVINWKEVATPEVSSDILDAVNAVLETPPAAATTAPIWADGPTSNDEDRFEDMCIDAIEPGPDASLYDRLAAARILAEESEGADQRSRAALYSALGLAYDFAIAAETQGELYAEILEDAGLTAQARAPMTPIAKLIFGAGYDKTRLAEYSAVLAHARRIEIAEGMLPKHLLAIPGGLKAIVKAERALRRPDAVPDREAQARALLAAAPVLATVHIERSEIDMNGTYFSLIGRREADGSLAIVSVANAQPGELIKAMHQSKI